MVENAEEKVNALTKLANLVGKQTLVMWCILTTFTTGYLFVDGKSTERQLNDLRIKELKEAQAKLIQEIKEVKEDQKNTKVQFNKFGKKIDTLVDKASEKLENMR